MQICGQITLNLEYLSSERKLSKGTQALMIQSIPYVCKWLGSNSGEDAIQHLYLACAIFKAESLNCTAAKSLTALED